MLVILHPLASSKHSTAHYSTVCHAMALTTAMSAAFQDIELVFVSLLSEGGKRTDFPDVALDLRIFA